MKEPRKALEIPDFMKSTVTMLRAAFPNGIPDGELPTLMRILNDSGMSHRSVGAAIGYCRGESYESYMYLAGIAPQDDTVTFITRELIFEKLRAAGYDEWIEES